MVAVERQVRLDAVDTVTDDGATGSRLVVDHLVGLGHRCIVHLDGGHGAQASTRRRGFVDAARNHGLDPWVVPSEHTEEAGDAAMRRLVATGRPFTAVAAANDVNAVGALAALAEVGLRVPEDVSVVGYDNTSLSGLRHIGLTTVNQPREEMGQLAVRAVIERVREGRTRPLRRRLGPSLVLRRTTAPPTEEAAAAAGN